MTALSGFVASTPGAAPQTTRDHYHLSDDLDTLAVDYWPPHVSDITLPPVATPGSFGNQLPVSISHRPVVAHRAASYRDDWYQRIHLVPSTIDVGNLISTQTRQIELWNAYLDRKVRLTDIDVTGNQGLTLTGPAPAPTTFGILESRMYELQLHTSGPPVIAAAYTFDFADPIRDPILRVTGRRVLAWPFRPNWRQGIRERLIWLTDVLAARDGHEQRQRLRATPRRQIEYDALVTDIDRQLLDALLWDWQGRVWALPIWADVQRLAADAPAGTQTLALATATRDFEPGVLLVLYDGAQRIELGEIESLDAASVTLKIPLQQDWPAGTIALPSRLARLGTHQAITAPTAATDQLTALFSIDDGVRLSAAEPTATYRGYPVIERRPNWRDTRKLAYGRTLERLDNQIGPPAIDDPHAIGAYTEVLSWLVSGRDEIEAVRGFLAARAGRLVPVWLPTWRDDVRLLAPLGQTQATLTVAAAGHSQHQGGKPGRRDLRIQLRDGACYYRRIIATGTDGAGNETLSLDATLDRDIAPVDVRLISWLMPARLDSDAIDILWHTTELMELTVPLRSVRDDV